MSETTIASIAIAIFGSVGLWGFLTEFIVRKRHPNASKEVTKEDEAAQSSTDAQALALTLAVGLQRQVDDLGKEVVQLKTERINDSERISVLQKRLSKVQIAYDLLIGWARNIHKNWDEIRHSPKPPDLPTIDSD